MARLRIRVQPRASKDEIGEMLPGGVLPVRVTAPPADGKANEAVIKVLAKHMKLPPSALTVTHGATSRNKVIEIAGLTDEELRQRT